MADVEKPEGQKPLIEYPTSYTFKVMGTQAGFRQVVEALFARLMGRQLPPEALVEKPSSGGKYVSISVTVELHSEEQRRGIYAEIHQEKRIVYYL
ncbi:MAG TPA: DUF493 domain-containing protein [Myxococcaceae bacterium]|nr:DUF493 domain-containing protein [Myxococcaceae bacterium]